MSNSRFSLKISPLFVFSLFSFLFMFLFFTVIHPIVVYDADDWTYISQTRLPIPLWGEWNPGKVFPETLMPFCGSIAAFLITPITNNYIYSFTLITAFLVAISISIYLYFFGNIIFNRFKLGYLPSILLTLVFFLAHFMIFRTTASDNEYLFWTHNLNCYYNYLIPSLLCFVLVFYLIKNKIYDIKFNIKKPLKSSFFILLIYLAIFSNLYCNIVLAVYIGSMIVFHFFKENPKIKNLHCFIYRHLGLFLIIFAWITMAVFELSGARAKMSANDIGYIRLLKTSIFNFCNFLRFSVNRRFILGSVLIAIIFFIVIIKRRKRKTEFANFFILLLICIPVLIIYFILVCAKVNTNHISSAQYTFGLFAYILLFITFALTYIIKNINKSTVIIPVLICLMFFQTNTLDSTFKESNTPNIDPVICLKVNEDILQQIISANQSGMTEMSLFVPVANTPDNWPHATYLGARISNTLFKHGLIDKQMQIKIIPSAEINEKYNIEY